MADLPLIDIIPLVLIILTIVIAVLGIYKYLKIEKRTSDIVITIAFVCLTIALLFEFLDPTLFDNDLGGLYQYFRIIAYVIFLFAIEPLKIIRGKE